MRYTKLILYALKIHLTCCSFMDLFYTSRTCYKNFSSIYVFVFELSGRKTGGQKEKGYLGDFMKRYSKTLLVLSMCLSEHLYSLSVTSIFVSNFSFYYHIDRCHFSSISSAQKYMDLLVLSQLIDYVILILTSLIK